MESALRWASEGLFPLLLVLASVATVWRTSRRARVDVVALAAFVGACFGLSFLIGTGVFNRARLLSWALFVHLPICLSACAFVLRRRRAGGGAAVLGVGAAVVVVIGIDAFFIEPRWLTVSHVVLPSKKVSGALRLALVADLQFDDFGDAEREVLRRTLAERPDVVLFAGDYVQAAPAQRREAGRAFNAFLREIDFRAPSGVFAVGGNVDAVGWTELFDGIDAHVFDATHTVVGDRVAITGLSISESFSSSVRVGPTERFHVVLGHAPDFALGSIDADLLVAGHTHGGQVQLPLIGPLFTFSKVPRSWASGVTKLTGDRTLVVSRGTGMERGQAPRLRFNCRPEIVLIDLVAE